MAQVKFNLEMIRQVITFIMTAGNVLIQVIDTIERNIKNV